MGFKFTDGLLAALAAVGLTVSIGFAFSWVSASIGLAIKDTESVQAASFVWIFPLTFISSALVPTGKFPPFLAAIARNNPVTIWANTVRTLTVGTVKRGRGAAPSPTRETLPGMLFKSTTWIVLLLVIFVPTAVRLYRKAA